MAQNAVNASRTKHINLSKYCLKDLERCDIVQLVSVTSMDQHADVLTKSVTGDTVRHHH
jgi:hypothetical protein